MPLFIAKLVQGQRKPHPDFIARGLGDFAPSTLSICAPLGIPDSYQHCYNSYVSSLSAFLEATVTKKTVRVTDTSYHFYDFPIKDLLPMNWPPVGVCDLTERKIKEDQWAAWEKEFGGRRHKLGGKNGMVFYKPNLKLMTAVKGKVHEKANTPIGVTNIDGLRTFIRVLGMVTSFTMTQVCRKQ